MKKITHKEVVKNYRTTNSLFAHIIMMVLGILFEIVCPAVTLAVGIWLSCTFDWKFIIITGSVFIIVLGIGLMLFLGVIFSIVKERLSIRFKKYRIVCAECIKEVFNKGDGDYPDEHYWIFKTDDREIRFGYGGVTEGFFAYFVVVGMDVVAMFPAKNYYADNYTTSFAVEKADQENIKCLEKSSENAVEKICKYIFLESFLFSAIAFDVLGILIKEWIFALCGGIFIIFYLLLSLFFESHIKLRGVISSVYLLVNGLLFCLLSYIYNHSVAAYITGAGYIFLFLLICFIYYKVKNGKRKK